MTALVRILNISTKRYATTIVVAAISIGFMSCSSRKTAGQCSSVSYDVMVDQLVYRLMHEHDANLATYKSREEFLRLNPGCCFVARGIPDIDKANSDEIGRTVTIAYKKYTVTPEYYEAKFYINDCGAEVRRSGYSMSDKDFLVRSKFISGRRVK